MGGNHYKTGDFNLDGEVNIFDLIALAKSYNKGYPDLDWNPDTDANDDGFTKLADLTALAQNWRTSAPRGEHTINKDRRFAFAMGDTTYWYPSHWYCKGSNCGDYQKGENDSDSEEIGQFSIDWVRRARLQFEMHGGSPKWGGCSADMQLTNYQKITPADNCILKIKNKMFSGDTERFSLAAWHGGGLWLWYEPIDKKWIWENPGSVPGDPTEYYIIKSVELGIFLYRVGYSNGIVAPNKSWGSLTDSEKWDTIRVEFKDCTDLDSHYHECRMFISWYLFKSDDTTTEYSLPVSEMWEFLNTYDPGYQAPFNFDLSLYELGRNNGTLTGIQYLVEASDAKIRMESKGIYLYTWNGGT